MGLDANWITAISTVVLVVVTGIYVFFSYKLTVETKKLREVETTPFISISFEALSVSSFKVVVKNISRSPAYNVSFEIDEKYLKFFNYSFKNKISYFAPNQEFSIPASGYEELDKSGFDNIPIAIKYESRDKTAIVDIFTMEWKYLNLTFLEQNNIEGIKKQ